MAQNMFGDALKKGEEMFQTVSGKLLEKPAVAKALEAAMLGKSKVDAGVATAFKKMNVQSRSEFRGLKARVESLETQIAQLREVVEAMQTARLATMTPNLGARPASPAAVRPASPAALAKPRARKATKKA